MTVQILNMLIIYSFLLGLLFGSFFNVVGLSVPVNQSFTSRRSACPHCGKTLSVLELIPVLSYIIQAGKCRGCKALISPLYPIIELATGLLFMSAPLIFGLQPEMIIAWTLISLFMIITVSDLKYMLIPDKILLVFAGIFLMERIFIPLTPWWDSLIGAGVGFSLLLLIAVVSKGGMGGGDIKLYALIGFIVGTKLMLLSFMFSTFFGAFFGVIGLLSKFVKRGKPIPFGPFIAIGTLTAYYFHEEIINFYLEFLYKGF